MSEKNFNITDKPAIAKYDDAILGDVFSTNAPIYDVTTWDESGVNNLIADSGVTDNAPRLTALLAAIPECVPTIVRFPLDSGAGYPDYNFETTVTANLNGKIIRFEGQNSSVGGNACLTFNYNISGNGFDFTGGYIEFRDLYFIMGTYPAPVDSAVIRHTAGIVGPQTVILNNVVIRGGYYGFKAMNTLYIYGNRITIGRHQTGGAGIHISSAVTVTGAIVTVDINNLLTLGPPNVPSGSYLSLIKCRGKVDGFYAINTASTYNIENLIYAESCVDLLIKNTEFNGGSSGIVRGIAIAGGTGISLENCKFNGLTGNDIEIIGYPLNLCIKGYYSSKLNYSGIVGLGTHLILGDSDSFPSQLRHTKGLESREADIKVGLKDVQSIGRLTFNGTCSVGDTFTLNGTVHTFQSAAPTGPNQLRTGTSAANAAARNDAYFTRYSDQRFNFETRYVTGNTYVDFYSKIPGASGNVAWSVSVTTPSDMVVDGAGYMGGQQLGVDPVDNIILASNGDITLVGILTGGSSPFIFNSKETDGPTAVAFNFDTLNSFTDLNAVLMAISNDGIPKVSIYSDGTIDTVGDIYTKSLTSDTDITANNDIISARDIIAGRNFAFDYGRFVTRYRDYGSLDLLDGFEIVIDEPNAVPSSAFRISKGDFHSTFGYLSTLPKELLILTEADLSSYSDFNVGVAGVRAIGTMTFTDVPVVGQTFMLDGQGVTLVAGPTIGLDEVEIGTDAAEQGNYVARDFNAHATKNNTAFAVSDGAGNVKFISVESGVAGNAISFTESMSNCTVDGSGFLGGTVLGVDPINNFTVDKSTGDTHIKGNLTSSGKIVATDTISYKRKAIFKTYSDFSTAAFTNTITLFALPAKAIIKDIYAWCSTPFKHGIVTENFTTNGTSGGIFQVADPTGFAVGNYVAIIDDDTSIVYGYIVAITDLGGGAWEIHIQDAPSAGVDVDLSNFTTSQNAKVYFNLTAYTFEIGITGTTNKYIASGRDIFTGALEFKAATDKGTALTTLGQTNLENMSVSTNIVCKVDSTNALLNQLSQGQLKIWIEYSDVE